MEFRAGDFVVHPAYGVGNVLRLEERQLAEAELRWYYVLAIDNNTVWVPVRADGSTPLRAVTSKPELDQYRAVLKSRPAVLEHDHNKRRLEINERLRRGSFQALCEAVRDLTALGWHRSIGETGAAVLHKVRDHLCREWAAAAGTSMPEAVREIDALLLTARETYQS